MAECVYSVFRVESPSAVNFFLFVFPFLFPFSFLLPSRAREGQKKKNEIKRVGLGCLGCLAGLLNAFRALLRCVRACVRLVSLSVPSARNPGRNPVNRMSVESPFLLHQRSLVSFAR